MNKTVTQKFLDSIWDFSNRPVPDRVIGQVKNCLIDYMACTVLGASLLSEQGREYLDSFGSGEGAISVIGHRTRAPLMQAAMLNGIDAHLIELDDGHRYAMLHLGAPVISALLVTAQDRKLDVSHFIKGIIVGYEATVRLAAAIQPGHKLKGFHATGTCGTIGTALGIAAALDLPRSYWNTVISAAATDAAGLLQVIDDGSELKPYNVGRAVVAAINAAYMGRTGLAGPSDVLGGSRGFFKSMAAEINDSFLFEGFLPDYAVELIYRKPYAACRHCHSAIEAALNILRDRQPDPAQIRRVEVDTYGLAVKGHDHTAIQGAGSAKMSIPYGVAAALIYGKVNYQQYEADCLDDRQVKELTGKVTIKEDPVLSGLVPAKRVAVVRVVTPDETFEDRVEYPLGEPENPMSQEMLEEKYFSLMDAAGQDPDLSRQILSCIYDLENQFNHFLDLI